MSGASETIPSLENIFRTLAKLPADKLLRYKHKLSYTRQDRRSCRLLYAMILLTLKREEEARVNLDALGNDPAAAYIYQSHWGGAAANEADPIPPEQEAGLAWAVAQIYSLLASEKWCSPLARDEAYQRAIHALQASGGDRGKLEGLLGEARERCGMDFTPLLANGGASAPQPHPRESLGASSKTSPEPLQSSQIFSDAQPLCSTGTPMSPMASHFEISASPTVPFLSRSLERNGGTKLASSCRGASAESSSHWQLQTGGTDSCQPAQACALELASLQITQPVQDAEPPIQRAEHPIGGVEKPGNPEKPPQSTLVASTSQPRLVPRPESNCKLVQRALSAPLSSTLSSCSSPSSTLPSSSVPCSSAEPPNAESCFFTFVVLHAGEDEAIACRVKRQLEDMGVSNGATYCEDFQIPGHCELSCFQDALDNSAFTLLLLTENFRSRLFTFQTNVALLDSFTRFLKANTVIPFVPREHPIKKQDMPTLLAGLVPLDENSPIFARRVKNTFTAKAILEKKRMWSDHQRLLDKRRSEEQQRDHAWMLQRLSANTHIPAHGTPGPTQLQMPPGYNPQFHYPAFPAPMMSEPHPASVSQPHLHSQGLASLLPGSIPPQFIIQNAQMVQIGDYNHMLVDRTNAVLGPAKEGTEVQQARDGED